MLHFNTNVGATLVNAIWKQQQQARERQCGPERDFGPSR